jgi:hypothetical protein
MEQLETLLVLVFLRKPLFHVSLSSATEDASGVPDPALPPGDAP